MPLARYAVYRGGPADLGRADRRRHRQLDRLDAPHRDRVGRVRRLGARSTSPRPRSRTTSRCRCPRAPTVFGRGGAAICEPDDGEVIAGPLYGEEGIVVADCDLRVGLHAKRWFDAAGHYSREDVLLGSLEASEAERTAPARRASLSAGAAAGSAPVDYPVESFTAAERAAARAPFHEPRPARLLSREPSRDGQGGALRPLFALPGDAAAPVLRGVRRRRAGAASGRSTGSRASAPRASTSGSSSATATTRSPRSAARTSPASGSRTCSRRSSSAAGSPPTSSSRPATSPTTSRSRAPAATATTPTTSSAPPTRAAMDELFGIYSRGLEARPGLGGRALAAQRR